MVYLNDNGYNAEGGIREDIPARGCSYVYLVNDSPEEEQLVVIPFVMRTLLMAGMQGCAFGPLH